MLHELGEQVTIGRGADCDVALGWDREVSRLHAQLEARRRAVGAGRRRPVAQRLVRQRRARRRAPACCATATGWCSARRPVVYRAPATAGASSTIGVTTSPAAVNLTPTQRQILVALCRPVRDSAFATPLTNKEIAEEVSLSVDAVKAHLRTLFERFGLEDLPQNQKRARLAAIALLQGIVTQRD